MRYNPGLHILSKFESAKKPLLYSGSHCRDFFNRIITEYKLNKVGEVYHDFEGGGFTAVVCLTESHMSIHTWPEFGLATFDVFLSNYQQENDGKAKGLYQQVLEFFEGTELQKNEIKR